VASSWQQSGHLVGKLKKKRNAALAGPASTAYALLLGHLCGVRGRQLFETLWARVLDCSTAQTQEYAREASRRAWVDYRQAAEVIEVTFSRFAPILREVEHGLR
jgi:hypothetical protein